MRPPSKQLMNEPGPLDLKSAAVLMKIQIAEGVILNLSMSLLFDQPIRVGQPVEHVVMSGPGEVLSLIRIRFACLACHLHISSHLG